MHNPYLLGTDLLKDLLWQNMSVSRELLGIWASMVDSNPLTIWGRLMAKDINEESLLGFPSFFGTSR